MDSVIDKKIKVPLHYQIYLDLLKKIQSGLLRPGERIPSEPELERIYEMCIRDSNGDGTFTSGFGTPEFKNAMTSFVNMAANQGVTPPGLIETGYSEAYTMIAADQACMFFSASNVSVSYTHLDVYKRQGSRCWTARCWKQAMS